MRYLIKAFKPGRLADYTPHLATDEGDERTDGSLWCWLWLAKRDGVEISVYRLDDVTKAGEHDQVLMIDHEGKPIIEWAHSIRSIAELKADPSIDSYLLRCVLDLS